ncbi:MAG: type IV toxin-antitoxin system AbiEi family antitoxin [Bacteroidales bacterium]|nr:type IV toxin-antitoxin system AbiEi family antitoxin [Bacteroidales bacterium]
MAVRDWINEQQKLGIYTFSHNQLKDVFPTISPRTITNELYTLVGKGLIMSPYRGFYSVIPPQYQLRGGVPPVFYVDQLMEFVGRPYYISLLSAAEMHGAAHQRPQRMQVIAELPRLNIFATKNPYLQVTYRKEIPESLVWTRNSEIDTIRYSSPELTAIDLVQFEHVCGGLSNVATVLAELIEFIDFNRGFSAVCTLATTVTFQRLGYLLYVVLAEREQASILWNNLKKANIDMRRTCLSPRANLSQADVNKKWKIIVNQELQIDDL